MASNVTANAPSVMLTSGENTTVPLTITTGANAANHAPLLPWQSGGAVAFGVVLLGAPFTLRKKRALAVLLTAAAVSLVAFSIACGSGGGGGGSSTTVAAARIYRVTVTPAGAVTNPNPVTIMVTIQ